MTCRTIGQAADVLGTWDKPRDMLRKIRQYLDAGVKLVLVLDPDKREIDVYPQDRPMYTLTAKDRLETPDCGKLISVSFRASRSAWAGSSSERII